MNQTLGPSRRLKLSYERKIGLLAKLVEVRSAIAQSSALKNADAETFGQAFVNLTYKELDISANKVFQKEFDAMDEERFGIFGIYGLMQMLVQLHGEGPVTAATAARRRNDPLACLFRALLELNPIKMPNQTWEIIAALNEFVVPSSLITIL